MESRVSPVLIGWLKFLVAYGLLLYVTVRVADWIADWRIRRWHRD